MNFDNFVDPFETAEDMSSAEDVENLHSKRTKWTDKDDQELIIFCRNDSLGLDGLAAVMNCKKYYIKSKLSRIGLSLLKRINYFDESNSYDVDIANHIIQRFMISDFTINNYRTLTKRSEEKKKRIEQLLDAELRYINHHISKAKIENVVKSINSGVNTGIKGALLFELIRQVFDDEPITKICKNIDKSEVTICHKLALIAAKLIMDNDNHQPKETSTIIVMNGEIFAHRLVNMSLSGIAESYGETTNDIVAFVVQKLSKYISQEEINAAIEFRKSHHKNSTNKQFISETKVFINEIKELLSKFDETEQLIMEHRNKLDEDVSSTDSDDIARINEGRRKIAELKKRLDTLKK